MPIDVRLLRSPDNVDQIVGWQLLRSGEVSESSSAGLLSHNSSRITAKIDDDSNPTSSNTGVATVKRAVQVDLDFRQAQTSLNKYKSSCRQQRKKPDPRILQSLQEECDKLGTALNQLLFKIANAVDEHMMPTRVSLPAKVVIHKSKIGGFFQNPYRRLVEFGAWEIVGDIQQIILKGGAAAATNDNNSISFLCWAGLGSDWAHAIACCLKSHLIPLHQALQTSVQIVRLPAQLPLENSILHQMLGCTTPTTCCVCLNEAINDPNTLQLAPSWLGFLNLKYSDQMFGDKQLPKFVHYSVGDTSGDSATSKCPDQREKLQEESFLNNQIFPAEARIEHTLHKILILTSSTYSDSRSAQQELAERLQSFYLSLLPAQADAICSPGRDVVRQRLVAPPNLLPAEASRIVIEGYLPKFRTDKDGTILLENTETKREGAWIILGYLSNFSDYPTRACRIKNNQQQFCHLIQGLLCNIPVTMCWHAAYGTDTCVNDKANLGVTISAALARHFPSVYPNPLELPQSSSLEKTKNGRSQIRAIRPSNIEDSSPTAKKGLSGQSRIVQRSNNSEEKKARLALIEPHFTVRAEQVQGEAFSSPSNFLPFYTT